MVHREGTRVVPYLGPDGFDLLFATEELVQDMQALSMLSMLKFRRFAWYLVGATDVSPSFAYKDKPNTVWVWADADWRGNARTCKSTSAVAVQLENYGIEAWSVLQQVVLLSSAESEFYAVDAPNVDRRETPDHRWNQIRRSGAYPETCAEDVDEQTIQAVEKVPDTIVSINNEAKCTRRTKEKLLGARRTLEPLTQKVAIVVAEFAVASPREPPDKMSRGQDALENVKGCPSDLDTRVLEREAMPRRVSKYRVVAVTTPWSTRAQWSCFGLICGLARTASVNDEVVVNGYWSKRGNGTTTGVIEAADSISTFAVSDGAGGAVARAVLVWRVAMSSCSVWSRQMRPSAEVQLSTRKREIERSVRQVDWRVLSAHRWLRQRTSHNRSSPYPQVTDHGLLSERK